jgi:ferredoxin
MLDLDDEACIDYGSCADTLPQFFEIIDGEVRIRSSSDEEEPATKPAPAAAPAGAPRPK